ncbi:AbrB/MazE/SpoVT family DNA-binding domain-containing protein [Patescibacteria group bacterium]|nr:AbrB/MazE/SpoVT family DNA-binding domain-containing protein [Patescibacteria group bacterium]
MRKKITCYGTTTIGPKGQIVIPSKLRKQLGIKTGDQFIVFKNSQLNSIVVLKSSDVSTMLKTLTKELATLEKKLK